MTNDNLRLDTEPPGVSDAIRHLHVSDAPQPGGATSARRPRRD